MSRGPFCSNPKCRHYKLQVSDAQHRVTLNPDLDSRYEVERFAFRSTTSTLFFCTTCAEAIRMARGTAR